MDEQFDVRISGGRIPTGLPGGFFIYEAEGEEKMLFAEDNVVKMFGCETFEEFLEYIGGSFKGMVHPDDLNRIENQIQAQTMFGEKRHDYVRYRIITKKGETRYIEDFGHLLHSIDGVSYFYVFIVDVDQNEYLNRNRNSYAEAEILSDNKDTDELTGLFNMSFFYHQAQLLLMDPDSRRSDIAFIHFNIPNFKLYNERNGFKLGDELLCYLARNIRDKFSVGICARFSDDNFFVCFSGDCFFEFSVKIRSDNYSGNSSSDKPKEESRGFVSICADFRIIVRAGVCKSWELDTGTCLGTRPEKRFKIGKIHSGLRIFLQ